MNRTPYVYRIKNKITGHFYYGCKYAKKCSPDTFWKDYFTSSEYISEMLIEYPPELWDTKIIKIGGTPAEVLSFESKLIKRTIKSKMSLNFRYNETYCGVNEIISAKMVKKRTTPNEEGITTYQIGGRKCADTKNNTILENGLTLMQQTVNKTANTRRERGDFIKLSEQVKQNGIGYSHACEYCCKTVQGGNFFRWHGENCKMNPNITAEQLLKREPANKGKESGKKGIPNDKLKGMVTCYDTKRQTTVRVTTEEFHANEHLVGNGSKGTPSYTPREVSFETREKLNKANKGKIVKESTKKLLSQKAIERKGLHVWVNNPITNEKTKIRKEMIEEFLNKNTGWSLGKGKNKNKLKKEINAR